MSNSSAPNRFQKQDQLLNLRVFKTRDYNENWIEGTTEVENLDKTIVRRGNFPMLEKWSLLKKKSRNLKQNLKEALRNWMNLKRSGPNLSRISSHLQVPIRRFKMTKSFLKMTLAWGWIKLTNYIRALTMETHNIRFLCNL